MHDVRQSHFLGPFRQAGINIVEQENPDHLIRYKSAHDFLQSMHHTSKSVYAGILISSNIYGCFWSHGQNERR